MRAWIGAPFLAALAACGAAGGPDLAETPLGGRDVVLVVVDTLRHDHLELAGYPKATAPWLSALAEDGLVFDRAYSGSSWTAPATASLFTSLYPDHHGVVTGLHLHERTAGEDEQLRLNRIPTALRTLPELMRQAGYRTFASVDNPNLTAEMGFARGFDRFAPGSYRGAEAVNADVLAWRDELLDEQEQQPYFLYLHYMDPHLPYHQRDPWYEQEGTPAPEGFVEDAARYDSEIGYLDDQLEQLFEALGLPGDALVLFTSDHGEEFGDHGGRAHGVTVHEELVRVPLVALGPPELVRRGRVPYQVTTLDLMPTLRELLGLPRDQHEEGVSLVPVLEGADSPEGFGGRRIFAHRKFEGASDLRELYLVLEGPLRLQWVVGTGEVRLYDLVSDPGTQKDLARARPGEVRRLLDILTDHRDRPRVVEREFAPARSLGAGEAEELGRLGYTD